MFKVIGFLCHPAMFYVYLAAGLLFAGKPHMAVVAFSCIPMAFRKKFA